MKGKRRSIEEKVRILRKADGAMTVLQVCDEHNISEPTFYRWKKEIGLLRVFMPLIASIATLALNLSVNVLRFLPISMRPFVPC